jgi:homoprotocatechuate degradation regulator HpaR
MTDDASLVVAAPTTRVRLRNFSRSLPMALLRAREQVMRHFRPSLRQFDLTEQQWRVLRAVASIQEIEITPLARATCLLAPSLTRILQDLEERGLVTRRSSQADLRLGLISITPQGVALMAGVAPHSEKIYAAITERFGPARMNELMATLRALEEMLQDLAVEMPSPPATVSRPVRQRGRPARRKRGR